MGIFGALSNAVAGMRSQSFALENVSGNIANSQTTAFKRIDTSFLDLIPETGSGRQLAGSVTARSRATNNVQGDVQAAQVATFMAINGDGYFSVQKPGGFSDNNPVFDSVNRYTRRGDFQLDKNGYLVNGAGYYLMGIPIDATTGNLAGSTAEVLKFQNDFLPAQQTTRVTYRANLASLPLTADYDSASPGSELLDPADFSADPTTAGAGEVVGDDVETFVNNSVAGGAVTAYDVAGSPVNIQFRWAKIDSAALGSGHADTWNLFYQTDGNATGTDVAWTNLGTDFTFGANGQIDPPVTSVTVTAPTINGIALGDLSINFGTDGLTQFADANGNVQVNQLEQDGFPAGQLQSVSVSDRGRIVGAYSNGRNLELAEIQLVGFTGSNFLKRVDGGAFEITDESGPPVANPAGRIVGSSLEGSNVDIADEFTKLIVTQQAYSANTRVVSVANEMVQEQLNMLR